LDGLGDAGHVIEELGDALLLRQVLPQLEVPSHVPQDFKALMYEYFIFGLYQDLLYALMIDFIYDFDVFIELVTGHINHLLQDELLVFCER